MVFREGIKNNLFAEDFEAAIGFGGDFFDGWIGEDDLGRVFVEVGLGGGLVIDGDGGDIDVEIGVVFEQFARSFGDAGGVATHIDDSVEALLGVEEGFDLIEPIARVWIPIADEPTDGWGQAGIGW